MLRHIMIATIVVVSLLASVATAIGLPKPPLIRTYEGQCGPGRLSCSFILAASDLPSGYTLYINSVANTAHSLQLDQSSLPNGLKTHSYVLNNYTYATAEQWTAGLVVPYCAVKDPTTAGVFFSIGCLRFVPSVTAPDYKGCEEGASFNYSITMVIRSPAMGIAGIDQPAVAELPYVAGDQVIPYSLTFRTPSLLPQGGWSLVMTANRVDWNEYDSIVGIAHPANNLIGITAAPYTATRAARCIPSLNGVPVPLKRIIAGGVAVSINNGYIRDDNQYDGFAVAANTEYQIIYFASYTTQALVLTASLAPHTTQGYGDDTLVYSHGSMAAGVILSLIFGGVIGAVIVHYRGKQRVQSGFNTVDESSHLARINQVDA